MFAGAAGSGTDINRSAGNSQVSGLSYLAHAGDRQTASLAGHLGLVK